MTEIVASAGSADGKFMIGIPAAASTREFERVVRANGEEASGHRQVEYIQRALAVLDRSGIATNNNFLGTALWGWAPKIEVRGDSYSPSTPFESKGERELLTRQLCTTR